MKASLCCVRPGSSRAATAWRCSCAAAISSTAGKKPAFLIFCPCSPTPIPSHPHAITDGLMFADFDWQRGGAIRPAVAGLPESVVTEARDERRLHQSPAGNLDTDQQRRTGNDYLAVLPPAMQSGRPSCPGLSRAERSRPVPLGAEQSVIDPPALPTHPARRQGAAGRAQADRVASPPSPRLCLPGPVGPEEKRPS